MALFKKHKKRIPDGHYRIIKIGKDALYEFIYESCMDNLETFLDISDGTTVVNFFDIDWEKGEFIFASRNEKDGKDMFETVLDTEALLAAMENTCDTLYADGRYVELSEEEILKLQKTNSC